MPKAVSPVFVPVFAAVLAAAPAVMVVSSANAQTLQNTDIPGVPPVPSVPTVKVPEAKISETALEKALRESGEEAARIRRGIDGGVPAAASSTSGSHKGKGGSAKVKDGDDAALDADTGLKMGTVPPYMDLEQFGLEQNKAATEALGGVPVYVPPQTQPVPSMPSPQQRFQQRYDNLFKENERGKRLWER